MYYKDPITGNIKIKTEDLQYLRERSYSLGIQMIIVDTSYRVRFENVPSTDDTDVDNLLTRMKKLVFNVDTESKDILRKRKHQSYISLDEIRNLGISEDNAQILEILVSLEEKYRIVIHLHYVEGYTAREIASMLGISRSYVSRIEKKALETLRKRYDKS